MSFTNRKSIVHESNEIASISVTYTSYQLKTEASKNQPIGSKGLAKEYRRIWNAIFDDQLRFVNQCNALWQHLRRFEVPFIWMNV